MAGKTEVGETGSENNNLEEQKKKDEAIAFDLMVYFHAFYPAAMHMNAVTCVYMFEMKLSFWPRFLVSEIFNP